MQKFYQMVCAIALAMFSLPCFAQTNAAEQNVCIQAQVAFGLGLFSNQSLLNYSEPSTTTAKFSNSTTVAVPPSTSNQQINLSTLFPNIATPILFGMSDISDPGQAVDWGLASGGTRFPMAAGGFMITRVSGTGPVVYVDNDSTTEYALLQVFCLGN